MAEQVRVNRLRRLNSPDRIGKPLLRSGSGISCAPPMPLCRGAPNYILDALKRQLATASTHPYQVCTCHMCSSGSLLPELLGKPDENSFGAPDVAEPIRVFVLDHFADELRAAFAEPGERIVDVLHGEHDA